MQSVDVDEPSILIRIPRLYREDMSDAELYDATRGTWRVGRRAEQAELALAIADGVVREVYAIERWHPAATTVYRARDPEKLKTEGRWEFTGRVALEAIRSKYRGRCVAHYFRQGQANPVQYVNI